MPRIVLFTGKGGVGKTTLAAATALASAGRGRRTLVLSFDLAHSLSDALDLDRRLFDLHRGLPRAVTGNLDVQEIDVQEELERHWGEIAQYATVLMSSAGVEDIVAEEMAIFPGMEDVVALLYLNQYVNQNVYDTIVVDCPPTGESLRFVSITATLEWYMRKRFRFDRNLFRLARPLANKISDFNLPEDSYFAAVQRLFERLGGVDRLLVDPRVTTVRLVTNAEKMVVRETQRAYMYFCMYGMTTDAVILNRLVSETDGALGTWAKTHATYAKQVREYFDPVPTFTVPLFPDEIVGLPRLEEVARVLYREHDPSASYLASPPYRFAKRGNAYTLRVQLPFAAKKDIDVSRQDSDLVIRIGSFKRFVPLPRRATRLTAVDATLRDGELLITLGKE